MITPSPSFARILGDTDLMVRSPAPSGSDITMHSLNVLLLMLATLVALTMTLLPLLTIDRNFDVTPELSLQNLAASWDPVMLEAIRNSVALSVIASLFAILCGSLLTTMLEKWTILVSLTVVFSYSVNPVVRALSYADLFVLRTPAQTMLNSMLGEWAGQMIVLPALILGIHYLPIYLLRFLFVIRKQHVTHSLSGILNIAFVTIPSFLRGLPIAFALFFLLTFFDYWVIQVISGGKALYWSQMFEQKAFVARDIGQAGMLIVIGLLLTAIAYAGMLLLCGIARRLWRGLRPLTVSKLHLPSGGRMTDVLTAILLLFLAWPALFTILELIKTNWAVPTPYLMNGGLRAIGLTLVLSAGVAIVSTVLSFAFSAWMQERPDRTKWWLPSLYFLALVPEAAYVLFSLSVTGLGILKGSGFWLFLLMTSFTTPMSFFLWESLWDETEKRKLWLIAASMRGRFFATLPLALKEWRRFFALTFIVNLWLTIDNVFITNFAAGPKWKPLSAVIFSATKRGFSQQEFLTSTLGSMTILMLIGCAAILSRKSSTAKTEA